jgi:hypothetical protein
VICSYTLGLDFDNTDFPDVTNVLSSMRMSPTTFETKRHAPRKKKNPAIVACGSDSCMESIENAMIDECWV